MERFTVIEERRGEPFPVPDQLPHALSIESERYRQLAVAPVPEVQDSTG